MKKIGYIEIDTHAEIAQSFMDIMQDSEDFAVDYYFSKKIKDQIKEDNKSVYLSDSSMILSQLKEQNYDLVIIGTVHRYFNTFLAITQKYNTAAIVHNINFIKASRLTLLKSIIKEDLIYRLKLLWKEGLLHSSKAYQNAKNQLVLDQELSSSKLKFLPLFYTKDFGKTVNENLMIVIPGGVSQKRRDYNHIFKTIQNLNTSENYQFVFLGKSKGKELRELKQLESKLPENITIHYFEERVSSDDFDNWMKKADFLWCPIQQETEFFSQKEIYGITKMTGNLGDAIKYGKLAIFPSNYPSKQEFIIPESGNIEQQFKELKQSQYDFQKNYSKKSVLRSLEQVFKELIST